MDVDGLTEEMGRANRGPKAMGRALGPLVDAFECAPAVIRQVAERVEESLPDGFKDLVEAACCAIVASRWHYELLESWETPEPRRMIEAGKVTAAIWREYLAEAVGLRLDDGWAGEAFKVAERTDRVRGPADRQDVGLGRRIVPGAVVRQVMDA